MKSGIVFLALLATISSAQAADIANGATLAKMWCAGCHAVSPETAMSDANPSFVQIAQRRSGQPGYIRAFLVKPHAPMPNFSLSNRELDDLTAFIESLQSEAVGR